jgi:carbamoyl-phosphate synthase large subunit
VLVTGTGGASGSAVLKALGPEKLDIFSADVDPDAGLDLVDDDRRLLIPEGGRGTYAESAYELCERFEIDVLIPTVDCELVLLASARAFFSALGTKIVLPSEETLRICLDRWALHRRCKGAVRVPDAWLADGDFDPFRPKLPVIVNPRTGNGSRGAQLIEQRSELERIDRNASLLVQEHLPGIEYSLAALATSGGRMMAVMPWAPLKVNRGIAATGRTVSDEKLKAVGRQVAERIGLTSVASIQLKEALDGELALLDVKPYLPGASPLAVGSGVNLPMLCVDDALASSPLNRLPVHAARGLRQGGRAGGRLSGGRTDRPCSP